MTMRLMKRKSVSVAIIVLIFMQQLQFVVPHGWLVTPQPRSGGGAGSGNASTQSPCGGGTGTTVTANYTMGQVIDVVYRRANSHGVTCNCVNFTIAFIPPNTTPVVATFTNATIIGNSLVMNQSISGDQTARLTLPADQFGFAALQFHWRSTDGSNWYDCAFVAVYNNSGPNPCTTNNGGCNVNANCAPNALNAPVCSCKSGYFGNGKNCTSLPPETPVTLKIQGPIIDNNFQDTLTSRLASYMVISSGRVLYDRSQVDNSTNIITVYFSVTSDPKTGQSSEVSARDFRGKVIAGDTTMRITLGYAVSSIQVTGVDASPVMFGVNPDTNNGGGGNQTSSSSSSSISGSTIGIIVGACVGGALLAIVAFVLVRRRGNSGKSYASSAATAQPIGEREYVKQVPLTVNSGSNLINTTSTNSTASPKGRQNKSLPPGWSEHKTDDGVPYFFNEDTGESRWTAP